MVRKIQPVQSIQATNGATVSLTLGQRLLKVMGESSASPLYDFTVAYSAWTSAGSVSTINTKYCGVRNGTAVNLWKEFPVMATTSNAPTALGHVRIQVFFGGSVAGQVFYLEGSTSTD